MSEVKRYRIKTTNWAFEQQSDGDYVCYDDYVALEAECERLADALDRRSVITSDYMARCQGLADERDALEAELAKMRVEQEQHPDDEAVDRFAVAMKAKLAKSREKGRHGWQTASAAHLSGLLYRHMYKADPLDVANLAMMLHQNGQAIELPHEARHDPGEVQRLRVALEEIADPIKFMRARLEDGEQLNGVYAIQMAESGNYLREIAKRALTASTGQEAWTSSVKAIMHLHASKKF